jgi:hypothetical protein
VKQSETALIPNCKINRQTLVFIKTFHRPLSFSAYRTAGSPL